MQPDLLVLPHQRPLPPAVPQPGQLVGVVGPDAAGLPEPARDGVEVAAVGAEIDGGPVGRPVVLGGQEGGQRGQPPVEVPVIPVLGGARDRLAELLAGVVLDRQHAVDVAAEIQRPDHVVRRPDQVVPAQRLEPLVFLAGHPGGLIQVGEPGPVELADDPGAAELLLVGVDHVAAGQPEDAEGRVALAHLHEVADDPAQEAVQRVVAGQVADVSSVHRKLPSPVPRRRITPRHAFAPHRERRAKHAAYNALSMRQRRPALA